MILFFIAQNVIKELPGATSYADRNISMYVSSTCRLFINKSVLRHIQKYTDAEAGLNNKESWTISLDELDAFNAIIYAKGTYGWNEMDYNFLPNNA